MNFSCNANGHSSFYFRLWFRCTQLSLDVLMLQLRQKEENEKERGDRFK